MKDASLGILIVLILAGALGFLLLGQSPTEEPAQPAPPKTASSPDSKDKKKKAFKVALITPGPVNDGGWSQNAYKGLEQIKSELNAETANSVAKDPVEALQAFRTYLDGDYDLIIGHASEWFDPKLVQTAQASPASQILISGCEKGAEANVAGVRFVLEDACYVLGYLAGLMTKTNVLGCVGPKKHPVIESTFFAFQNGAQAANPKADVRIVWTQSWDDVARAKEQTLALISEKADMIFHNANNGAPGVFQAVRAKKDQGVFAFGSNDDQSSLAPDVILASAVLNIPSVFLDTARDVLGGKFDGRTKTLGMPEGYVWVAYNEALATKIPAELRKKADAINENIKKGNLKVERKVLK